MAKTKNTEGKRYVYQYVNGEMRDQIVEGETPNGWYDLIREARMAGSEAPSFEESEDDETGEKSPVSHLNVNDAKAEIAGMTGRDLLQSIIDLDTRKGATDAAKARLEALPE